MTAITFTFDDAQLKRALASLQATMYRSPRPWG